MVHWKASTKCGTGEVRPPDNHLTKCLSGIHVHIYVKYLSTDCQIDNFFLKKRCHSRVRCESVDGSESGRLTTRVRGAGEWLSDIGMLRTRKTLGAGSTTTRGTAGGKVKTFGTIARARKAKNGGAEPILVNECVCAHVCTSTSGEKPIIVFKKSWG